MLFADLSRIDLLRRKDAESDRLRYLKLAPGMTLISCSGTIGRTVYAREEMDGVWSSQDTLKVVPDGSKIPSGYLYAFLSSKFGVPLVIGGTYGAIIQHIEPQHISGMPIPRFDDRVEQQVDALIQEAASLRQRASNSLAAAQRMLRDVLGPAPPVKVEQRLSQAISSRDLLATSRFDAFYHNPTARVVEEWMSTYEGGATFLEEVASVFDVPPFKHIYVDARHGVPFYTSGDIFLLDRKPDKYLSRTRTKDLHKYILRQGWVLLARSGQLGGIIATPQFADSVLDGAAASDHVIRIVPKKDAFAGFLFTYLSLPEVGYQLMLRTACGTSIPALWPVYLNRLRVPTIDVQLRKQLDELTTQGFEDRVTATAREDAARLLVENVIVRSTESTSVRDS
jgi:type I restriction enzyme S subunit